jgi:hypothetical protein
MFSSPSFVANLGYPLLHHPSQGRVSGLLASESLLDLVWGFVCFGSLEIVIQFLFNCLSQKEGVGAPCKGCINTFSLSNMVNPKGAPLHLMSSSGNINKYLRDSL